MMKFQAVRDNDKLRLENEALKTIVSSYEKQKQQVQWQVALIAKQEEEDIVSYATSDDDDDDLSDASID